MAPVSASLHLPLHSRLARFIWERAVLLCMEPLFFASALLCICAYWKGRWRKKIKDLYVCCVCVCACVCVWENAALHMWSSDAPAGLGVRATLCGKKSHLFASYPILMCRDDGFILTQGSGLIPWRGGVKTPPGPILKMRRAETCAPFWNVTLHLKQEGVGQAMFSFWQRTPSWISTGSFGIHWPVRALSQAAECQC